MDLQEALRKLKLIKSEDDDTKQAEADVLQVITDGVVKAIGMENFATAIKTMDEFIKKQDERLTALETVITKLAADDVERVHQLVTSGDWTKDLFTASRAGEGASDEEVKKAKQTKTETSTQEGSQGSEIFFGGVA